MKTYFHAPGLFRVFVALFLLLACLNAYALPPWLTRGGAQQPEEEEILRAPDFEPEEEKPYFRYAEPERQKGPFLWVFIGFLATAFITTL